MPDKITNYSNPAPTPDKLYTPEQKEDYAKEEVHVTPSETSPKSPSFDKTDFRLKAKFSSYAVTGLYARLAGAGNKSQVQSAMGEARRSIGMLRMTASLGSSDERQKARASIASLQKLLQRGGRKIRRLNEEELTELRRKRAQRQEQQERALKLQIERNRQRAARRTADRAIALEGHLTDVNNAYLHRHHEEENPAAYLPTNAVSTAPAPVVPGAVLTPPVSGGSIERSVPVEEGTTVDISV